MQINHATEWHNKMLGRYRLGRLLGRGGMGEVWQAEDTKLHRQVAVKLLPSVVANETEYLHAFADEARTIASLEHPHILPIHDFGEEPEGEDIVTYLITPLIPGGSLRERMHTVQGLLPVKEALHYLRQAAEAIDYAHSRQVLHRDIKPANMLLQQQWLFLADFGLAKLLSTDANRNHTYAGSGTPDYMAPEQVQGKAEAASDRYSLAVIAYQIFSGHKPFSGADPYEILIKQIQEPPPAPRQFNPHMPQAVEEALLKGLAKQPAERPTSCIVFINELEQSWLADSSFQQASDQKPVAHPKEDPEATILAPWSKRYAASQATYLVAPPITADTNQPYPLTALQEHATTVAGQHEAVNPIMSIPELPHETEKATPKIGRRGLLIGGSAAVVAIAGGTELATYIHSRSTTPTPRPTPGPHKLIAGIPLLRLEGHTDQVWSVVWHPSGRYLTTAGIDTYTMLWDVESMLQQNPKKMQEMKQPLQKWKFAARIDDNMLSWSKDGRTLAVMTAVGFPYNASSFINVITDQQKTPTIYTNKNVAPSDAPIYNHLAWSPVDNLLAASIDSKTDVELWQRGKPDGPLRTLQGTPASSADSAIGTISTQELTWSHDGALLAGIRDDFTATIWAVKTGKILQTLTLPDRSIDIPPKYPKNHVININRYAIEWSPRVRNNLVVCDLDVAVIWNAVTNRPLSTLRTDDLAALMPTTLPDGTLVPQFNGLAWSPNGRYIAGSYEHSHQIYIWDTLNKHPRKTQEGFHADDLRFGQTNGHVNAPGNTIIDLAWSPDGRYLATASTDNTAIIWRVDGA